MPSPFIARSAAVGNRDVCCYSFSQAQRRHSDKTVTITKRVHHSLVAEIIRSYNSRSGDLDLELALSLALDWVKARARARAGAREQGADLDLHFFSVPRYFRWN
jgi:hypothetical protein